MISVRPGVAYRYEPVGDQLPIVVDVSRSGREYPEDFRSMVPFTVLHDNVSMYVDRLWEAAPGQGATLLYALFPNTYIDVNRDEQDIDLELIEGLWPGPLKPTASKRGLGLLKSKTRYGEPVQERKLTPTEVTLRLDRYYRPYHAELRGVIDGLKRDFGFVYQLSCHCMSAIGAPTHVDAGRERADFCLGNLANVDGQSATKTASEEFVRFLADTIKSLGYSCTVNYPYGGGELIGRYGAPDQGVQSVLVEINKKLFMDVETFKPSEGFDKLQSDIGRVLSAVANHARAHMVSRGGNLEQAS
jgi:N-formylglutamate deformylase